MPRASHTRISKTPDLGSGCCDEETVVATEVAGDDDWDEREDDVTDCSCEDDDWSLFSKEVLLWVFSFFF